MSQAPVLRDLGSTNGTFVNNAKAEQVHLVDGDVIRIGEASVVFKSHWLER
jgi:pSer/pThr/pTyr-binding forkhead associated (FHA) protein